MPFIDTHDGTGLYYRDWGRGAPVVLLSGWALSSVMWQYQMQFLVDNGRRCVALDRRGHGRSDDPGRGFDYDTLAADVASLVDGLDLRGITFVGHSMACGEIVRYLSRHAHAGRVARVVFLAPVFPYPLKTPDNPEGIDGALFETVRQLWRADYPKWLDDNAAPYFGDLPAPNTVSQDARDWTVRDMTQVSLIAAIECNRAIAETDFRAELRALKLPVLTVQGDRDASMPIDLAGRRVVALVPGSKLEVYETAPHGLYLTHRDRLNHDLLRFMQD
jgi:non-heme chloroperoxidase